MVKTLKISMQSFSAAGAGAAIGRSPSGYSCDSTPNTSRLWRRIAVPVDAPGIAAVIDGADSSDRQDRLSFGADSGRVVGLDQSSNN
ncbi:hypothetical protein [Luteimonas cucumeris]|uniref:hypothetical protein n=1 Tax=Luteimonas cucumeris TaxID=985012 RepID=UPI0011A33438|nr:hypothetical protein [Luteimonas cucumeris]